MARALGRMLHTDDPLRLTALREIAGGPAAPDRDQRLAQMLSLNVFGTDQVSNSLEQLTERIRHHPARREELQAIVDVVWDGLHRVTVELDTFAHLPLRVHARYGRNEALAAFGVANPQHVREGVKWVEAERADVFFVTLAKSEEHYSPTTMYADRAISPELFQWESVRRADGLRATHRRAADEDPLAPSACTARRRLSRRQGGSRVTDRNEAWAGWWKAGRLKSCVVSSTSSRLSPAWRNAVRQEARAMRNDEVLIPSAERGAWQLSLRHMS